MKTILLLAVLCLAGGCDFRAKAQAQREHAEMNMRIAELDARIAALESENRELRARLDASASAVRAPSDAATTGEYCTATDGIYRISRSRADSLFASDEWAGQARLVPSIENGVASGFKLFSIRPSSVFAQCGFQNGDVVKTVNGLTLESPDSALDAYAAVKRSNNVVVSIVRQGKPQTVTIEVDP